MENFEEIYDSMAGQLTAEAALPWVENAFSDDSLCQCEYDRMRSAYERVCQRLGGGEDDADLDRMVDALECIQRELCRRMYQLGLEQAEKR